MLSRNQRVVMVAVRTREDFQAMRKRMHNRLGVKSATKGRGENKVREEQDLTPSTQRHFDPADSSEFAKFADSAMEQEKEVEKKLKSVLGRFPIYNEWLRHVKGVGTIISGYLLGNIDIEEATTVSKIWQFAGLNPDLVRGKKRMSAKDYKSEMGEVVKKIDMGESKPEDYIVLTDEMIRGDKLASGFVSPFNQSLRVALMGILAPSFIKSRSSYAIEFYYPYKNRLEQSDREVLHIGKMVPWKDVNKGHRDFAARRYMVKMFLKDLYAMWRPIEGLSVRKPYSEEYLGKVHA